MRPPPGREALTVSEITSQVDRQLSKAFRDVWVQGEITDFSAYSSGHWYFTLKDDKARLRCVMFRFKNSLLRFRPDNGAQVLCRGKLSVYAPRGEYQLGVEYMEPTGRGALYLELERLKARLAQEGLFDAGRKRPLPGLIKRVAVITSPEGAVIHDMLRVLAQRAPAIEVLIVPSRVQGAGAGDALARALDLANRPEVARPGDRLPLDAVVLARGGGSLEDLWAFNEEVLARAIAASALPVVSAVGHETDFTIADLAADVRASTPTAAAELIAAPSARQRDELDGLARSLLRAMDRSLESAEVALDQVQRRLRAPKSMILSLMIRVDELSGRARRLARGRIQLEQQRLSAAARTLAARDPSNLQRLQSARLDHAGSRLLAAGQRALERPTARLDLIAGRLAALSPRATLERGYAIARDGRGRVLREADRSAPGDAVEVILGKGRLETEVRRVITDEESDDG